MRIMKLIKFTSLFLLLVIVISCTNTESKGDLEKFQKGQEQKVPQLSRSSSEMFLDSIKQIDSKMESLMSSLEGTREQISFLTLKKDSIQSGLEQLRISTEQINSKKIDPGIKGVNLKLDELKGQKENLQEQLELQKKEIDLAEKKIKLQEEEKLIYDDQRKALWDKGAPPNDFKKVDSLITYIDNRIQEQTARLKFLNRNSADIEEQITAIDQQRNSLSTKIRNNYTAQEIYEEFSVEEKERLEKQLASVEEQLEILITRQEGLNSQLALFSGDKNYLQIKQDELDAIKLKEEARLEKTNLEQQQLKADKADRNRKILIAFIGIIVIAIVLYILYYIGKKRKLSKLKK